MVRQRLSRITERFSGPRGLSALAYTGVILYQIIDFLSNMDWVRANMLESSLAKNVWSFAEPFSGILVAILGLLFIAIAPTKWPWENPTAVRDEPLLEVTQDGVLWIQNPIIRLRWGSGLHNNPIGADGPFCPEHRSTLMFKETRGLLRPAEDYDTISKGTPLICPDDGREFDLEAEDFKLVKGSRDIAESKLAGLSRQKQLRSRG